MPKYLFVYHGGKAPESEEEGRTVMVAWEKWMTENGAGLVEPGAPVGMSKTVSQGDIANDGGANPASGYTVVEAADIEAACAIATSNPMVMDGSGSVEVAEIIPM